MLSISAFGPFVVTWNGKALVRPLRGRMAALLAYLAAEQGSHRRAALISLFWPEAELSAARLNLRQTLFQLRALLKEATGVDFIDAGRDVVGFAPACPVRMTALEFGTPLPVCSKHDPILCADCFARLSELARYYVGPFLADMVLPECPDFEEWMLYKRDSLHRRALDLLMRLSDCQEQRGDRRAALASALRYVELEPWSEAGHLRAMRLYAQDGRCEAALAQYETCRRELERELGVAPCAELQRFAEGLCVDGLERTVSTADRRQVTVLYCEISAAEVEDPEDVLAVSSGLQARCADIIRRHAGHIAQAYSGGLLAYFGYPLAQENASVLAVRVARMLAAEARPELSVRVGGHSGLVVTAPESQRPDAIGATSGVAIRLRELAEAGDVVVSAETRRRTAGYFLFAKIGRRRLRGSPEPMEAFKVLGETGARHRLAAAERLSPFTGRTSELATLLGTWLQARRGKCNAALISGEAGIGKSRLVDALKQRLGESSGIVRELRCLAETKRSPLQPVTALLAELCGFLEEDDIATRLAKLDMFLTACVPGLAERSRSSIALVMGLANEDGPAPAAASDRSLQVALELLADVFCSLATRQPMLLVVEDMHWADESTVDLIRSLVERQASVPMFVLLTARPQWQPAWPGLNLMPLVPLGDAEVRALIETIRGDVEPGQLARIVACAEGVPLFAEELAAIEIGAGESFELPVNLQDLLMARLDSLGPARNLAQLAATAGREIKMAMLADLSGLAPQSLSEDIDCLRRSGLVQEMADGRLRFKHALVRDAAYRSQTRAVRQAAHRRVAEVLERRGKSAWQNAPEVLAQHWSEADEAIRAVPLWLAAGRRAASCFAHREAIAHFEAGTTLLVKLPESTERNRWELGLLLGLAQSEQVVWGYGRGRSAKLQADAEALLDRGGSGADLFSAVWGMWEGAGSRVDHREAVRLARRLVAIAESERAPALFAQGHYALGNSLFWYGDFTESRCQLEIALATLPAAEGAMLLRDNYGSIVAVGIHVYLSWVIWLQGDTELGEVHSAEALAIARASGDAYSLAFALTFAATLQRWQGNIKATLRLAEEGRTVASNCASAVFEAAMGMTCGWAAAMQGDVSAVTVIERSVNAIHTAMSAVVVPLLAPFAEVLLHRGEFTKALPILDEALVQVEAKQDRHYLAELHRMKGVCLLAQEQREAALVSFEAALAVAREQRAVAFERRALAMIVAD
ncbi:AAA family ATPase [uncultured Propionivibrio sp.]|uniref:AAA family ATPase n=1 Tax=uncultured Propionivibrio sp. TaxID=426737 RepID=UPI0029BFABDC|nr:AAA family ATPase [uncultured Propionivibrio sp.]